MRFLLTMNMPSAQNFLVHQLTVDHDSKSCEEFCEELNDNEFITVRLLYRQKTPHGDIFWSDRGDIIINTSHIGKAQEYLMELEREDYNEPPRNFEQRRGYVDGKRPALRPRGTML